MKTRITLSFGLIAPLIFVGGTLVMGALLPYYNPVSQTVSEIGEIGSKFQTPYTMMDIFSGISILVFSIGLGSFSRNQSLSLWPSPLIASYGLMNLGLGIFSSPHPLHNIFGLGSIIGYLSPLVLAFAWRKSPDRNVVVVSWMIAILVIVTMFLNLSPVFWPDLYPLQYYGIIQRSLLYPFFGWLGYLALWALGNRDDL